MADLPSTNACGCESLQETTAPKACFPSEGATARAPERVANSAPESAKHGMPPSKRLPQVRVLSSAEALALNREWKAFREALRAGAQPASMPTSTPRREKAAGEAGMRRRLAAALRAVARVLDGGSERS